MPIEPASMHSTSRSRRPCQLTSRRALPVAVSSMQLRDANPELLANVAGSWSAGTKYRRSIAVKRAGALTGSVPTTTPLLATCCPMPSWHRLSASPACGSPTPCPWRMPPPPQAQEPASPRLQGGGILHVRAAVRVGHSGNQAAPEGTGAIMRKQKRIRGIARVAILYVRGAKTITPNQKRIRGNKKDYAELPKERPEQARSRTCPSPGSTPCTRWFPPVELPNERRRPRRR